MMSQAEESDKILLFHSTPQNYIAQWVHLLIGEES